MLMLPMLRCAYLGFYCFKNENKRGLKIDFEITHRNQKLYRPFKLDTQFNIESL
jgi:hypothetical protein